ncbi:MAG: hypothetical protein M1818_003373 [Claussenomyces sp. TS43310]|nr:MAG: hypothetical protein M1818_003373 [Claussenomyces sp. TS43310]
MIPARCRCHVSSPPDPRRASPASKTHQIPSLSYLPTSWLKIYLKSPHQALQSSGHDHTPDPENILINPPDMVLHEAIVTSASKQAIPSLVVPTTTIYDICDPRDPNVKAFPPRLPALPVYSSAGDLERPQGMSSGKHAVTIIMLFIIVVAVVEVWGSIAEASERLQQTLRLKDWDELEDEDIVTASRVKAEVEVP